MVAVISILPDKLQLLSLPRSSLRHAAFGLLKNVFAPRNPSVFFNVTENSFEVSIVACIDTVTRDFPSLLACPGLVVCPDTFRALQIEDDVGQDNSGKRINQLAGPLARAGISIFYISTYQTDFVLVKERRLPLVVSTLHTHDFQFVDLEADLSLSPSVALVHPQPHAATDGAGEAAGEAAGVVVTDAADATHAADTAGGLAAKDHVLAEMRDLDKMLTHCGSLRVIGLSRDFESEWALGLLQVFLADEPDSARQPFLSFTSTVDGISLVADAHVLDMLPAGHAVNSAALVSHMSPDSGSPSDCMGDEQQAGLCCIQVDLTHCGLDRFGIVFSMSDPLVTAGLNLLYLSTYKTANLLVDMRDLDQVLQILEMQRPPTD
ncbi:ACT domain-containing protein [Entophlyctis helioformis]|nr:ACT domain-containing protein [Entophlyctis helioformis]